MLGLARGERVAEGVGDGALAGVLAALDGLLDLLVGKRVQAGELQRAGAPDGGQGLLGVRQTGNLHEDLVGALLLHGGLARAERVHAALDDGAGLLHVLGRDRRPVGRLRGEHHRQAALDVETLVDLLLGRDEQHHRCDDEQRGENEQPDVATVVRARRLLLDSTFQSHELPFPCNLMRKLLLVNACERNSPHAFTLTCLVCHNESQLTSR